MLAAILIYCMANTGVLVAPAVVINTIAIVSVIESAAPRIREPEMETYYVK